MPEYGLQVLRYVRHLVGRVRELEPQEAMAMALAEGMRQAWPVAGLLLTLLEKAVLLKVYIPSIAAWSAKAYLPTPTLFS